MSQSTLSPSEQVTEETGKPGTNFRQVTPGHKKTLSPLMRHYGKMAHPFTACVRDNRKRFGERAERVCAVLKDLIRGTTKWRGNEAEAVDWDSYAQALYEAADGDVDGLVEMYRESVAQRLDIVIDQIGPHATALLLIEDRLVESKLTARARKGLGSGAFVFPGERRYPIHDLAHARNALARSAGKPEAAKVKAAVFSRYPQLKKRSSLREEVQALADEYLAIPGEPNALTALIEFADDVLIEAGASNSRLEARREKKRAKGSSDSDFESKHPRGSEGTPEGGRFVQKGSSGSATRTVQEAVGAKTDGQFGPRTQARVKAFQKRHGLQVDGIVGKQTSAAILGNRQADKLNPGQMTESQRARLRDGGRSRKRKAEPLREEEIVESVLGGLRRGASSFSRRGGGRKRKYDRVGAGHDTGGQFSKAPVAAIGKSLAGAMGGTFHPDRPPARATSRTSAKPSFQRERNARSQKSLAKKVSPTRAKDRGRTDVKPTSVVPAKGAPWGDAEKEIPAALRATPEWKAAYAEAQKQVESIAPGKWNENDTQATYSTQTEAGVKGGVYTGSRADLHRRTMALMFQGVKKQPEGKRVALFMAGGGAAGKSSLLRDGDVDTPEAATLINADLWKLSLPDEELLRDESNDEETRKKAAGKVHEESSTLAKRHMALAQARGTNFIMDGTGDGSPGKFAKQLAEARAAGFDVKLAYATTYVSDALERNEPRFEKTGRYVDPGIISSAHVSAAKGFQTDVLPNDYDFEIWDTGSKPAVLIASREGGKGPEAVRISDDPGWQRFLARANGPDTRADSEKLDRVAAETARRSRKRPDGTLR